MRQIAAGLFVSLDGVVEAPETPEHGRGGYRCRRGRPPVGA
jgi:hypothetical protein